MALLSFGGGIWHPSRLLSGGRGLGWFSAHGLPGESRQGVPCRVPGLELAVWYHVSRSGSRESHGSTFGLRCCSSGKATPRPGLTQYLGTPLLPLPFSVSLAFLPTHLHTWELRYPQLTVSKFIQQPSFCPLQASPSPQAHFTPGTQ